MSDIAIRRNGTVHDFDVYRDLTDAHLSAMGVDYLAAYAPVKVDHTKLSYSDSCEELKEVLLRLDKAVYGEGNKNPIRLIVESGEFHIALSVPRVRRWLRTFHPERVTDVATYGCMGTPVARRAIELGLDVEEVTNHTGSLYILVHKATGNRISVGGPYSHLNRALWNMRNRMPWAVSGQFTVIEDKA